MRPFQDAKENPPVLWLAQGVRSETNNSQIPNETQKKKMQKFSWNETLEKILILRQISP